jgi:hypothetical protein
MKLPTRWQIGTAIAGTMITVAAMFCAVVTFQTITPDDAPIALSDGMIYAWGWEGDTVIYYQRTLEVKEAVQAEMYRTVTCTLKRGEQSYDLQPLYRDYKLHENKVITRLVNYPVLLPVGTPCVLETTLRWWPAFSMSWHSKQMSPMPFVVRDKPYDAISGNPYGN